MERWFLEDWSNQTGQRKWWHQSQNLVHDSQGFCLYDWKQGQHLLCQIQSREQPPHRLWKCRSPYPLLRPSESDRTPLCVQGSQESSLVCQILGKRRACVGINRQHTQALEHVKNELRQNIYWSCKWKELCGSQCVRRLDLLRIWKQRCLHVLQGTPGSSCNSQVWKFKSCHCKNDEGADN